MTYIDGEGGIIVPKSVRPIIDYEETILGTKKGAKKQFRYGKLHIREYKDYYIVHMDKVDPRKDPVGHLLIDAPEVLSGYHNGIESGKASRLYCVCRKKRRGKQERERSQCFRRGSYGSMSSWYCRCHMFLHYNQCYQANK